MIEHVAGFRIVIDPDVPPGEVHIQSVREGRPVLHKIINAPATATELENKDAVRESDSELLSDILGVKSSPSAVDRAIKKNPWKEIQQRLQVWRECDFHRGYQDPGYLGNPSTVDARCRVIRRLVREWLILEQPEELSDSGVHREVQRVGLARLAGALRDWHLGRIQHMQEFANRIGIKLIPEEVDDG